jgi:two-component system NarL family response regulator
MTKTAEVRRTIRLLVVDDHPVVRQGLVAIVDGEPDMTVIAQCADGQSAVDLYREHLPDVVLMDLRLPLLDGTDAIAIIKREFRTARIIILTTFDTDEDLYKGLRAGAMSYILKGAQPEELLEAIRAACIGKKHIPSDMAARLTERIGSPELTEREMDVLRLLVAGKSNKEVAADLGIEEGTVRAHCNNLFRKLEVNDRTQAAVAALKRGLVRFADAQT